MRVDVAAPVTPGPPARHPAEQKGCVGQLAYNASAAVVGCFWGALQCESLLD